MSGIAIQIIAGMLAVTILAFLILRGRSKAASNKRLTDGRR